jgi:hypothetical protein
MFVLQRTTTDFFLLQRMDVRFAADNNGLFFFCSGWMLVLQRTTTDFFLLQRMDACFAADNTD